ncbi:MAG: multiple monosaccharide ABC transporter permease [Culicoidibacterales bacterium]
MNNKIAMIAKLKKYGMLIALLVIVLFFYITTGGISLTPLNITNLMQQNAYVLVLAIGMTLCILTGGNIDLSVGSVCAFVGAVVGILVITYGLPVPLAILLGIITGGLIGVWQGFWIAKVRIPSFIVTLAGMLIFRGLTIWLLKGTTLSPFPPVFQFIGGGYLPNLFGGSTTLVVAIISFLLYMTSLLLVHKADYRKLIAPEMLLKIAFVIGGLVLFTYWFGKQGIPISAIIVVILVLIYSFFTNKTVPGRYLYAVGGNEKAAKLSGINTNKVLFFTYVNMAMLAAVGGIIATSRLNAAAPTAGMNYELDAIAACYIGGCSAKGGVGTIIGAVIGAIVMGVLNNGMSILGVGTDMQMAIKGLVLLGAVAFDIISKTKIAA